MKRGFKCLLAAFIVTLFVVSSSASYILAASDYYESSWLGYHYIARANLSPSFARATLSHQNSSQSLTVHIDIRYQIGTTVDVMKYHDTRNGFAGLDYSAVAGMTLLSSANRYVIGSRQVYQNSLSN